MRAGAGDPLRERIAATIRETCSARHVPDEILLAPAIDEIYESHHAFHLALLAPAATDWDIRVLGTLWRAAERYIRIGFGRLDPNPSEHGRREQTHHDLVSIYRTRDSEAVAQGVHDHLAHNEQIALRALDVDPPS
jgi:DNA-binding GntR family transcriptional regulator